MSAPIDTTEIRSHAAIQSAMSELASAESSLHMRPDPIPGADAPDLYISQTDANVAHAIEHMHAVFELLRMAHSDQEDLKCQVFRLVVQINDLGAEPRIKTFLDESTSSSDGSSVAGSGQELDMVIERSKEEA